MDKYLKLDLLGKGCNGNCVIKVKNLEDGKVFTLIIIDICIKENFSKCCR
jgi:hypothetical protein